MRNFHLNALGVRFRLGLVVLLSILALLAVGFGGWFGITRVSNSVVTLQEARLPAAMLIGDIRGAANQLLLLSFEVLAREKQTNAQSKFAQTLARKEALTTALTKAMEEYDRLAKTDEQAESWNAFKESMKPWMTSNAELSTIIKALAENDDAEKQAQLFMEYKAPLTNWGYTQARVDLNLASLLALNKEAVEKAREADSHTIVVAERFMLITLGVAIAVLLALAVVFVRSITAPLERLRRAIVSVAGSNDFTERADIRGKDEIAQTADAFNRLLSNMQDSLREVLGNAENIGTASEQASSASQQAASSSESQSEAATSMAAAVEEMTVSIAHIGSSAQETLGRAREAGAAADRGARIIAETHTEMDKIADTVAQAAKAIDKLSQESGRISTILQVIKDVADQTNLLALNAAIEAARAGEQGRGFAVVADEVRKLAERTTASTDAIGELVVSMQSSGQHAVSWMASVNQQVAIGKSLSDSTVGHIDGIRESAQQVVAAVTDISEALNEQSATAQNIAQQVETVARLSETNNATARETETISADLDRLSTRLITATGKFRV